MPAYYMTYACSWGDQQNALVDMMTAYHSVKISLCPLSTNDARSTSQSIRLDPRAVRMLHISPRHAMLHASFISACLDERSMVFSSVMVSLTRHDSGGVALAINSQQQHQSQGHISVPPERFVTLSADMHRRRWHLHVCVALGRIDITVASRKEQAQWAALLKHRRPFSRAISTTIC